MIEDTVLVVIDVQGKLAHLMHQKEDLFGNLQKVIKGIQVLDIPILWVEQNPKGLGTTIPEVASLLTDIKPISKLSFSCYRNEQFIQALKDLDRKEILIVGIETHICVYQSAVDLVKSGFDVQVLSDAVSSRTIENKKIGLEKMKDAGVRLTSVETALFELLEVAKGDQFKQILKIVK